MFALALVGFVANALPGIVEELVGSYVVFYAALFAVADATAFIILRFYRPFER